MYTIQINNPDDLHTILAALAFYQMNGQTNRAARAEIIDDIATNSGTATALDLDQIDVLRDTLNTEPQPVATSPYLNRETLTERERELTDALRHLMPHVGAGYSGRQRYNILEPVRDILKATGVTPTT